MNIPILYEDNHLLVVEKPPGIPSQEDDTKVPDMLTLLKEDIKVRFNKPGNVYLGLVHRLDQPVGGAMLFAKTSKAASRMSEAVRSRQFAKTYMCIVHGHLSATEQRLTHYIEKDTKLNKVTVYNKPIGAAKQAILSYKKVASNSNYTLIAVQLETGRPHQIRAQMAHIGHPLLGDTKYGQNRSHHHTICLWSTSIGVPHPTTKNYMQFTSVPPLSEAHWYNQFSEIELKRAATILLP